MAQKRRQPEIIAGIIDGATPPNISRGDGFSVTKASTGTYDITITGAGFRIVSITVTPAGGAARWFALTAITGTSFRVLTLNTSNAAVDDTFAFAAYGVQQ